MEQAFTTRRALHQQCTSASVTGEIPTAMYLSGAKHTGDITNTGSAQWDALLSHREQSFLWAGCLDAPELLPAGSTIPVNISPDVGGMGYEGNVARIVQRESREAQ